MSPPVIVAVVLAVLLLIAVVLLVIELRRGPGAGKRAPAGPAVTGAVALDEVDRALRVLVTACDRAERELPDVYAVECAADRVVLRLATYEQTAPEPWAAGADGTEWTLSRAGRQTGGQVPADSHPYPLIVTLGLHEDRRVLVNLGRAAGPIALAVPDHVTERLLTELLTGPIGRDAEIVFTGDRAIGLRERIPGARTSTTLAAGREQHTVKATTGGIFQQLDDGRAAAEPGRPRRLVIIGAGQYRAAPSFAGPVLVLGDAEDAAWRFEARPDGGLDTGALGLPVDTILGPSDRSSTR